LWCEIAARVHRRTGRLETMQLPNQPVFLLHRATDHSHNEIFTAIFVLAGET
jgi:hypothetical protein